MAVVLVTGVDVGDVHFDDRPLDALIASRIAIEVKE
jgi:hypothetical protein